ncbi:hypothetical protein FACS1894188_09940 [Clostridia bacterium]|nr:hypothetical protein FACS1894188_09940 [Clostridia bacterium]
MALFTDKVAQINAEMAVASLHTKKKSFERGTEKEIADLNSQISAQYLEIGKKYTN